MRLLAIQHVFVYLYNIICSANIQTNWYTLEDNTPGCPKTHHVAPQNTCDLMDRYCCSITHDTHQIYILSSSNLIFLEVLARDILHYIMFHVMQWLVSETLDGYLVHSWSNGLFTLACCGLHVPQA